MDTAKRAGAQIPRKYCLPFDSYVLCDSVQESVRRSGWDRRNFERWGDVGPNGASIWNCPNRHLVSVYDCVLRRRSHRNVAVAVHALPSAVHAVPPAVVNGSLPSAS